MLATVAFTMTSCLYGMGEDEEVIIENRLTLNASTTVIYANGTDQVLFSPKYGSKVLTEEQITLYDGETDEVVSLPGLCFTTDTPGKYTFYATYQDGEELKSSEMVTISAIEESDINVDPTDDEGLTFSLSTSIFQAGNGYSAFVVRYNGQVLNADQLTIYNADSSTPFTKLETMEVKGYTLPVFRSTTSGTFRFYAEYKVYQSAAVAVTVVDFAIPPRMEDPNPEKLNFKRRVMLIDHTGVGCQYCPYMLAALDDLSHDEEYGDKFVLTAAHTFGGDPYAPSNAKNLDGAMGVTTWPTVVFDMATYITNLGYESNKLALKKAIDQRLNKGKALAGISASMAMGNGVVVIRMSIKAAETSKFLVGAWLMEDGIYAAQMNHGMPDEGYDFNTHNHVIRYLDSATNYIGHTVNNDTEVLKGEVTDYLFQIPLEETWKTENCYVCLFVSTPDSNGNYTVNNVVVSNSLTESVSYEYID